MSILRTTTLQDAAGSSSVPMATVAAGTAKAWVNFNGTGTVTIRASFNVSSITDNGVGIYTVNFTNALADTNYSVCASYTDEVANNQHCIGFILSGGWVTTQVYSTAGFRVAFFSVSNSAGLVDKSICNFSVFR